MRAVQFGGDVHRQIEIPHRLERYFRIGHRDRKVAPEADQRLRTSIPDRLDSLDGVVALVPWRLKSEYARDCVQKLVIRNLGNADRAVALYIRMATQRRDTGALAPDVAAKHQQIGDLLHIAGPVAML